MSIYEKYDYESIVSSDDLSKDYRLAMLIVGQKDWDDFQDRVNNVVDGVESLTKEIYFNLMNNEIENIYENALISDIPTYRKFSEAFLNNESDQEILKDLILQRFSHCKYDYLLKNNFDNIFSRIDFGDIKDEVIDNVVYNSILYAMEKREEVNDILKYKNNSKSALNIIYEDLDSRSFKVSYNLNERLNRLDKPFLEIGLDENQLHYLKSIFRHTLLSEINHDSDYIKECVLKSASRSNSFINSDNFVSVLNLSSIENEEHSRFNLMEKLQNYSETDYETFLNLDTFPHQRTLRTLIEVYSATRDLESREEPADTIYAELYERYYDLVENRPEMLTEKQKEKAKEMLPVLGRIVVQLKLPHLERNRLEKSYENVYVKRNIKSYDSDTMRKTVDDIYTQKRKIK